MDCINKTRNKQQQMPLKRDLDHFHFEDINNLNIFYWVSLLGSYISNVVSIPLSTHVNMECIYCGQYRVSLLSTGCPLSSLCTWQCWCRPLAGGPAHSRCPSWRGRWPGTCRWWAPRGGSRCPPGSCPGPRPRNPRIGSSRGRFSPSCGHSKLLGNVETRRTINHLRGANKYFSETGNIF